MGEPDMDDNAMLMALLAGGGGGPGGMMGGPPPMGGGPPPMGMGMDPMMGMMGPGGMPPMGGTGPGMGSDPYGVPDPFNTIIPGEPDHVFDGLGTGDPQMGLGEMIKLLMLAKAGVGGGPTSSGLTPDPASSATAGMDFSGGGMGGLGGVY
jgi:hypothetical protein